MFTCGYLKHISILILVNVGQILRTESAPVLATNRRAPVEGVSFSITCTLDAAITATARFYKDTSIQGGCMSSGTCGTSVSGYNVSLDSTSRILTLDIASPDSTRDSGTWTCINGATSNNIILSQFAAVLDWRSVTFSPQLTSLPSYVTPQNTISVTVTTPCAAPPAVITWRYQQGVSGVPPSSTSSSQGSCPSGQVQTTNSLSLPGNTASLYNRQVSLTVSVEHDSFDPPTYTKSATSSTVQFPVPVTSVTLTNINSDNEKIGQAAGQSLTLTCVTSASFPISSVTWVTLPSGTTPTVSTATTSGVLVKTTSSVTFTVSRSDHGRSIHCQAENINGQTSPQSNRVTLDVWYGPDTNQVRVTKPANTVVAEDRDLTLTCETLTSVSPGVIFTWDYSDGSGITGGSTGSVTGSASTTWSQTLTFRPVRSKTDVRCSVRNNRTAVTVTKTLSLGDVKYPPPGRPTVQDFPTVMYAGVQKTIRCTVTGGNPLADITWSCYNTSNTGSESSREGTKTSSLTFLVTKHQNSRQCQCGASWMYGGYNETVTQTFTVYYAPDITFSPVDITEGQPLTLKCEARGRPASYTFRSFIQYWGNTSVDSRAGTQSGGDYTWGVGAATYLDTGVYECRVNNTVTDRNDVLVQRKRVSVNVRAHPKFTSDSKQRFGAEVGTDTTLVQSVYNSDLNYTSYNWTFGQLDTPVNRPGSVRSSQVTLRKNNKEVQHAGFSVSLEIQNFQEQDIGVYTVTVCNEVGCNSTEVHLSALGPPLVPLEFMVVNTTVTSVLLRWKSNYPGGDYTQTFLLHYRVEESGEWRTQECEDNPRGYVYADVTGLQSGTRYEFKVMARNTRKQSNEGPFTQVESQETKSNPPQSGVSGSSLGIGLGVGLGICIIGIIVMAAALIYLRRCHLLSPHDQGKPAAQIQDRGTLEQPIGNTQNSDIQNLSQYARFEECAAQTYSQLKIYENTKGGVPREPEYEGLQERSPTTYEAVALHTYVNIDRKVKDPTYANTSTT